MRVSIRNPNAAALYAILYNSDGQAGIPATGEFEESLDANQADYAIPLQVSGQTDKWYFELPSEGWSDENPLPAGVYDVEVFEQQGAEPAAADPVTEFSPSPDRIQFDGTGEAVLASLVTASQANAVAAGLDSGQITAHRGDSLSVAFSGLGSLTGRTKLHFTVKRRPATDEDTAALLQIEETLGLLVLNGEGADSSSEGDISVTDAAAGDLTVTLAATAAATLPPGRYRYDLQMKTASAVQTLGFGEFVVQADVTRTVS